MPAIPALRRKRQERQGFKALFSYRKFEASLDYMIPCLDLKKEWGKLLQSSQQPHSEKTSFLCGLAEGLGAGTRG